MPIQHYAVAAAVTALIPAGLLAAEAGASIAREASAPTTVAAKAPTVALHSTKKFGKILVVGSTGRALYVFAQDGQNKSKCTGSCTQVWPPLMLHGTLHAGRGVSAKKLGEIKRGAGHQVTYAGHPLYTFASDSAPGQVTGEHFQNFFVVSPSGKAINK